MNELSGKIALVTGATGFLGGALAHRLAADGVTVKALARDMKRAGYLRNVPGIDIFLGDILDAEHMQTVVQGCDVVFHVAAALGGSYRLQHKVNVEGTINVAQAAAHAGVERLVHVSTISVYGYCNTCDVSEDTPPAPGHDPYHETKLHAEDSVRAIAGQYGLDYAIVRPSMIYGPRSGFWTRKMFQLSRGRVVVFVGSGMGSTYPIHVDDVVDMITVLAIHPNAAGQVFNCTPDPSPTWREFLTSYQCLAGHKHWLGIAPLLLSPIAGLARIAAPRRSQFRDLPDLIPFVQRYITYRMDKAHDLLDWEPRISLREGIESCVPYLRDEGLL